MYSPIVVPRPRASEREPKKACESPDVDPGVMFPAHEGKVRNDAGRLVDNPEVLAAKQVCWSCDDRLGCAVRAIKTDETVGIWGGMTKRERKAFKRKLTIAAAARKSAREAAREARQRAGTPVPAG